MQQYPQIIRFFYRKIVSKHHNKISLLRSLNNLIQKFNLALASQTTIKRNGQRNSLKHNAKNELVTLSENKWQCNWVYSSLSFEKTLLFAIVNKIIASQYFLGYTISKERIMQMMEEQSISKTAKRIVLQEWQKIGNILLNKKDGLASKLVCQSIERIPVSFYQCLMQMFCKDAKTQQSDFKDTCISSVSRLLNLKLNYYQLQGSQVVSKRKFGFGQDQLYLCYVYDLGKYTVCEKAPFQAKTTVN